MKEPCYEHIYVNKEVLDSRLTKDILNRTNLPYSIVNSSELIEKDIHRTYDPVAEGKKYIYLTKNKGRFIKKCPGTSGFICCNYYVIDLVENCPFECSYCFLQSYLNKRMIRVYVNIDDLFHELDILLADKTKFYRIGTGELSDSLALDYITNFSSLLIDYFNKKTNAILELKTKSNFIDRLIKIKLENRVVISWSLNPNRIIESDEHKTASLSERINSAYRCQEHGYLLAFHFDPIVYYDNCLEDYSNLINMLFSKVNPERISWISLGGFRYNLPLDKIIDYRFPDSNIIYNEFFKCSDGKMRYFIRVRENIYKNMIYMLKAKDHNLHIYLCMEAKYMWKKIYGYPPKSDNNLDNLFKQRLDYISLLTL